MSTHNTREGIKEIRDYRAIKNVVLTKKEQFLLFAKASLIGTDAKDPEKALQDYVEKLITEYIMLYANE